MTVKIYLIDCENNEPWETIKDVTTIIKSRLSMSFIDKDGNCYMYQHDELKYIEVIL